MRDCTYQREALVPDLGALASRDILGVEQASYDLIRDSAGRDVLREVSGIDGELQFSIAKQLGIGSRRYRLSELK